MSLVPRVFAFCPNNLAKIIVTLVPGPFIVSLAQTLGLQGLRDKFRHRICGPFHLRNFPALLDNGLRGSSFLTHALSRKTQIADESERQKQYGNRNDDPDAGISGNRIDGFWAGLLIVLVHDFLVRFYLASTNRRRMPGRRAVPLKALPKTP